MPDKFDKKTRSKIMSAIRSKNTKIEIEIFNELKKKKIYFQKHFSKVVGKPDIAIPSKRIAVFIDSDFWHGWQFPRWKDRLPKKYWLHKIANNRIRDKKNMNKLRKMGWKVLRIWDHQLKNNKEEILLKIVKFLE